MTGRRTRITVVVAAVLVGGGVAAALTVSGTGDDAAARSDLPSETAEVVLETLVDTQTEDGDLGYGEDTTVTGRIGGTVTALPLAGAVIDRGQAVYHVDDTPVVLLFGTLPAYRTLAVDTEGAEGADVRQFEENLSALGYGGFTVDDEYTDATADAVEAWQEDLGLAETGTVDLGRVVYAPGAVRVATLAAAVGDATQPGGSVLTHTGTTRVVTVELEVADQRLAVKDAAVAITLPDGRETTGKITGSQTVIETTESTGAGGEGDTTETKLEVTVTPDDPAAFDGLDQATVDIGFTASTREDVLTVPVAALLALAEGGYGVEVVEGRTSRIIAVETGLFAGGRVEVSGTGLSEGQNVGMPS